MKYRVTRVGRPSPIDWPQAAETAVKVLCGLVLGGCCGIALALDWPAVDRWLLSLGGGK